MAWSIHASLIFLHDASAVSGQSICVDIVKHLFQPNMWKFNELDDKLFKNDGSVNCAVNCCADTVTVQCHPEGSALFTSFKCSSIWSLFLQFNSHLIIVSYFSRLVNFIFKLSHCVFYECIGDGHYNHLVCFVCTLSLI